MYKSLQAARAFAAMLVVLFHLGGAIAATKYFGIEAFSIPFSFGSAGVEFFFVLSGFIILTAHRNDIGKPRRLSIYLRKRITRIYPTYWIIFLLVLFIAIASPSLRNTVPHDALILFKSLLLIPQDSNVVGGTGAPVLGVAWTLQYEVFFYFYFASLILSRWLGIVIGLTILGLYIIYHGIGSSSFCLSFLSKDYILLFAMGMAVSVTCTSKKIIVTRPLFCASIGVIVFIIVALDVVIGLNLLSERRTILYGLASCLIIFGLVQAEDEGQSIGGHRSMQILGDSSYALYLIHYPLISILCKFFVSLKLNEFGIAGAMISYAAILAICLISSVVFHLWIEKPVTAYCRNHRLMYSD
jgi:exopolysaccharide production protein ExoZ